MPSFLARVVVVSALAASLLACSSAPAPSETTPAACEPPASPVVFELGTGESCFERIAAGQTLPTMRGPQGGWHLWMAFGCADCAAKPVIHYGAKDPDTGAWLGFLGEQTEVAELDTSAWPQIAGLQAYLPGDAYEGAAMQWPTGSHVVLSLSVEDAGGTIQHQAETEVVMGDVVVWGGQPGTR